jgi:hypothetical protein
MGACRSSRRGCERGRRELGCLDPVGRNDKSRRERGEKGETYGKFKRRPCELRASGFVQLGNDSESHNSGRSLDVVSRRFIDLAGRWKGENISSRGE